MEPAPAKAGDPSLGRYTQPDPLGFVDGPSVYAYGGGSPTQFVDFDGRFLRGLITVPEIVVPRTPAPAPPMPPMPGPPPSFPLPIPTPGPTTPLPGPGGPKLPPSDPPAPGPPGGCKYQFEKYYSGDCKQCVYECPGYHAPVVFPQGKNAQCMGFTPGGLVDTSQITPECRPPTGPTAQCVGR